jgi:hypothetical protein
VADSVDNLFKLGYVLGCHADASADHDAVVRLAREAVQNVATQRFVRPDGEMLHFPTPIMH